MTLSGSILEGEGMFVNKIRSYELHYTGAIDSLDFGPGAQTGASSFANSTLSRLVFP